MIDVLPWLLLFPAYALLWWPAAHRAAVLVLFAGLAVSAWQGLLTPPALLAFALLTLSAALYQRYRLLAHLIFIATAVALAMHWLPGFHNPRVIDSAGLKPDAAPFRMYLNLDKPLAAWWVLLVLAPPLLRGGWQRALSSAALATAGAAIVCLGLAWALGFTYWSPGWPPEGLIWLLNNALLVTLAEEALFRGYVQEQLARRLHPALACLIAALLFGLAHLAGGPALVALATVAGLFYGWAYHRGGLSAAVLAHLALNTLHFGLFVYPAIKV